MYYIEAEEKKYAGVHILIDMWYQSEPSIDTVKFFIEKILLVSGSKLIEIMSHEFNAHGGISVLALLSQSHISFHSWPEYNYAAIDIFLCGNIFNDELAAIIEKVFLPQKTEINLHYRGIIVEKAP